MAELPPRRGEPRWSQLATACRADPGGWHLVGYQLARSMAWHIQQGHYAAFRPAGQFESQVRNCDGSRADVWVRYRGRRSRS